MTKEPEREVELEQKILESCDKLFPDVLDFTEEMVKQYSVLNQEQGVLEVVERQLSDLNLSPIRVPIDVERLGSHPMFAPVPWGYDHKYNLVSVLNPGASGKSLVFNGHLDVVPATPFEMWTQRANEPWRDSEWLYGRGSGDMQSGVAAMIYAVQAVREAGAEIRSPLTIQTVVEEECTGNGALACVEQGYDGDFVLIPEPFGPTIYSGQLGVMWFKVLCQGTPVHVQDTSAGEDAIERLLLLIPALKDLEAELNEHHRVPPYDQMEHPFNLNVGKISGGDWASSVPAHAEFEARLSFPPGMTASQFMQMVSDRIESEPYTAASRHAVFAKQRPVVRFEGFRSEGHLIDVKQPGIRMLESCHRDLTSQDAVHYLSTCTTDLRAFHFYNRTGGTCYGPVARNIHGVDESVNMESVRQTLKTNALFISRWCEIAPA